VLRRRRRCGKLASSLRPLSPNYGIFFAPSLAPDHDWSGVDMKISLIDELRELERLKKASALNNDEYFAIQILLSYRNFFRSSKIDVADFLNMSVSDLLDLTRNGEGVSEP
jgi:hypothetical protein